MPKHTREEPRPKGLRELHEELSAKIQEVEEYMRATAANGDSPDVRGEVSELLELALSDLENAALDGLYDIQFPAEDLLNISRAIRDAIHRNI
jgi:hypothetical protein